MMTTNMAFKVVGKTHRDGELTITEGIGSQRMIPSRRFPALMPRWERRRIVNLSRRERHAYMVLARLNEVKQNAKWDDTARIDKVEEFGIDCACVRVDGKLRFGVCQLQTFQPRDWHDSLRAAIDAFQDPQANPAQVAADSNVVMVSADQTEAIW